MMPAGRIAVIHHPLPRAIPDRVDKCSLSAAIIVVIAVWMLIVAYRNQRAAKTAAAQPHDHAHDETKIIDTGHGLLELFVFEAGVPPRFRVRFLDKGARAIKPPADESVTVETLREGGARQRFRTRSEAQRAARPPNLRSQSQRSERGALTGR